MTCNDCEQQMEQRGSTGATKPQQLGEIIYNKWVQTGVDTVYIYQCPICKTVALE